MTPKERVQRTRAALVATILARAFLWGAAVGLAVFGGVVLLDVAFDLAREMRALTSPLAWAGAVLVVLALAWRGRRARTLAATALWIEERVPALQYALVTALEPAAQASAPLLAREIERHSWESAIIPRTVVRALAPPLLLLALASTILLAVPRGVVARVRAPRTGDALDRAEIARNPAASRLSPVVARVTPPPYTPLEPTSIDDPATIAALVGSRVELEGRGRGDGISGAIGSRQIAAGTRGNRWYVAFTMPSTAALLRLRDREFDRLIVLDARPDSAPVVTMVNPTRDTIFRTPSGRVTVRGNTRDALGLASTWLEYIVSSGQGETFRFRSGVLGHRALNGAQSADIETLLSIDSLRLAPGDVVHMRLVARDRHPSRDSGTGTSETRVIRIARAGEYDSVAVEGAPPPDADTSAISQRMLILLTEALVKREPRLARDTVVRESRAIGLDQSRLRRRVGEIIFSRLTGEAGAEHAHEAEQRGEMTAEELLRAAEEATEQGVGEPLDFAEGESPVVAINRPLLEAYNAMWSAAGELNIGAPRRALPHMYVALAAIERARQAERVYLRGRPATVVVDVNRARLAGKRDSLPPAGRTAAYAPGMAAPAHRFARATALIEQNPDAAIDSLLLLRVELLDTWPTAAGALGEVISALREGRPAAPGLRRTRAVLGGAPRSRSTIQPWAGLW